MPNVLWLEHAAIAEQRIEDAGEATGEGNDGHLFPAARGDAQSPGPQLLGLRRAPAEDGDGGLNQEPAGARVAGLGDGTAALGLPRAVLAGHEAEVGFELMRVVEAPDVVDGGEEGGGGDGPDAGDGAQPGHARILDREVLDRGVGKRQLPVERAHEGEQGRDHVCQDWIWERSAERLEVELGAVAAGTAPPSVAERV